MQQGPGSPAPAMDVSPEQLRVLVVESNASSRQAIVGLLKECSYQVRLCAPQGVLWGLHPCLMLVECRVGAYDLFLHRSWT